MYIQKLQATLKEWFTIPVFICIFGFLKEIRPSEPFNYEFLIGKSRNLTSDDVIQQVYPIGTFSHLAQLLVVFVITDLCRYKPVMILSGIAGITVWLMYICTASLQEVQIIQIFYGTFCASEVAQFTYIYSKVDLQNEQLSFQNKSAVFVGKVFAGIVCQLIVSFGLMDYRELNYITLAVMVGVTFHSLFLPLPEKTTYFHQSVTGQLSFLKKNKFAYSLMWQHISNAYSNKYILKWSFWWTFTSCGFFQTRIYIQPLWSDIARKHNQTLYNGAAEALFALFGFLGSLLAGRLRIDWKTKGDLSLTCCSLLQGFSLLILSQAENVKVSYACYVVFGILFYLMITVANSEIARYTDGSSYGLIFVLNTFVALAFQSLLISLVVNKQIGFALSPKEQYFVYGIFHVILACTYIVIGLCTWLASKKDYRKTSIATQPVIRL